MKVPSPKQTLFRLTLVFYTGLLAYYSLAPVEKYPGENLLTSYGLHIAAYLLMVVLAAEGFESFYREHPVKAGFRVFLVGLLIELGQLLTASHSFSPLDLGLNLAGIILGSFEPSLKTALTSGKNSLNRENKS